MRNTDKESQIMFKRVSEEGARGYYCICSYVATSSALARPFWHVTNHSPHLTSMTISRQCSGSRRPLSDDFTGDGRHTL